MYSTVIKNKQSNNYADAVRLTNFRYGIYNLRYSCMMRTQYLTFVKVKNASTVRHGTVRGVLTISFIKQIYDSSILIWDSRQFTTLLKKF